MINKDKGYSYNDLTIVPEVISHISSRSECIPYLEDNMLPIFTAPMASVVSEKNYDLFKENHIYPIIPRNISLETRIELMDKECWVALSLKEFETWFIDCADTLERNSYYVCVDIANGHMKSLYDKCKKAKALSKKFGYKLFIMTGNIANADTYRWICENIPEIDYIRVGIGGGSGCITTSNTAIHYPQASLIEECYCVKKLLSAESKLDFPKIVADGGIRNYDHVIKALALGADYVMIGSVLSMCVESAGEKSADIDSYYKLEMDEYENWWGYTRDSDEKKFIGYLDVKFFGMASANGQKSISGEKTKTAEGITKLLPVKYTLKGWVENMTSYLQSAMSYTDCENVKEFIGKPTLIVNSISEIGAVNK